MSSRGWVLALVFLVASACTATDPPPGIDDLELGGTLRLTSPHDPFATFLNPEPNPQALDPTFEYESMAWELLRCCLTRTLYSYVGRPAEEEGSELRPDLASGLPSVSAD